MATTPNEKGRGWAYIGAALGGGVSIAANIAHSYIPPKGAPADWSPEPGAVFSSMFWPIALFVALEILTRIPWPAGKGWVLLRFGGLLPVALVAAVVSYKHLSGLIHHYGEDQLTVVIGPLAVDGLMTMATGALLATATHATKAAASDRPKATAAPAPTPEHQAEPDIDTRSATDITEATPEPASAFPTLAAWSLPTTSEPARVNGHTPAEVTG